MIKDSITLSVDDQVYGIIEPPSAGFGTFEEELKLDEEAVKLWREGSLMAPFDQEVNLTLDEFSFIFKKPKCF